MPLRKQLDLKREYKIATQELANLNRELASKMILLASQTGDPLPLKQAVKALETANELYSQDNISIEAAQVRKILADTLLTLGRTQNDIDTLQHAITAYRSAITLSSLLGDDDMRLHLRNNYKSAKALLTELCAKDHGVKSTVKGAA